MSTINDKQQVPADVPRWNHVFVNDKCVTYVYVSSSFVSHCALHVRQMVRAWRRLSSSAVTGTPSMCFTSSSKRWTSNQTSSSRAMGLLGLKIRSLDCLMVFMVTCSRTRLICSLIPTSCTREVLLFLRPLLTSRPAWISLRIQLKTTRVSAFVNEHLTFQIVSQFNVARLDDG